MQAVNRLKLVLHHTRSRLAALVPILAVAIGVVPRAAAQAPARRQAPPTIEERTQGMRTIDGLLPLYWDEAAGQLWMEIPRAGMEVIHIAGLSAGLGSNDIGLDRGVLQGSRIVRFERVGPKILVVQPNTEFRANSRNAAEVRAVEDAFARSTLWGFTVAAETQGRVLVDMNEFLIRDATNIAPRLQPGTYRLDNSRSAVHMPGTMGFPKNTEMEVTLTFASQPGGGGGGGGGRGGGGAFFEGVGSVAASAEAATLRVHHSFIELPDAGYEPRLFDPRSGFGEVSWKDYATPLGEDMTKRYIRRHRLAKVNPSARVSDPVRPIVYYLDAGAPEPIRSALLEGARWWNQAFEAAGYRNAFRVELRPDSMHPLDARYNVINWVHRSTRGWSTGASVTDPRTGEIIKGVVTLGSLRIRQDYMIAEGLLSPYANGTETPPELSAWALARIRQLAAHEVGHTLGYGHNYYDSRAGRISVMDYPHPLVTLRNDGSLDYAQVYERGIGEWDSVSVIWGYQDFPDGTDERTALRRILDDAWERDVRYMSNQDADVHPGVDQWSNGTDAARELDRMMEVRRVSLARFGERAIRRDMPMATIEEVLVPLYLHHRYQVEAAASVLGGQFYIYAMRGDGRQPYRRATGDEQRGALRSLLATVQPSALALPAGVVAAIPPRPSGWGMHRELFPRWTGGAFDAITPAVVAADHVFTSMLSPARAARLVEQAGLDPSLPGLDEVIDNVLDATFNAPAANAYEQEIRRTVQRVAIEQIMSLAGGASMPQVRAVATHRLRARATTLAANQDAQNGDDAHFVLLAMDIRRFLERPAAAYTQAAIPVAPPGAPIGEPGMDWLGGTPSFNLSAMAVNWLRQFAIEPWCSASQ